jgi:hypothetical protein
MNNEDTSCWHKNIFALSRNRAGALARMRWSLDSFAKTFARLLLGLQAIDAEGGDDAVIIGH